MRGYGPWHPQTTSPELIEPKGKLSAKHPLLGYANLPGKFHVTLSGGHRWKVTHLSHGLRATHLVQSGKRKRSKKEIWILGCSFTYGWGVNDNETFTWLLQEQLPNYEVVNFGVCGYGTMHSLIQFREALKEREKPVTAVIVYASFHDERNTMLRSWRKACVRSSNLQGHFPYARLDADGNLQIFHDQKYFHEFPFMRRSALMHQIEQYYNRVEDRYYCSHEVTKAIMKDFARSCRENSISLVVASVESDPDMLQFCEKEGAQTIDISVDLKQRGNAIPGDGHPTARVHRQYAQKLEPLLRNVISSRVPS
jgi:hypothetical protein